MASTCRFATSKPTTCSARTSRRNSGQGLLPVRGLLQRRAKNAEAWTDDGWFRTGDICSFDEDGRITYRGRVKDMLKVGGENVAAAEIEGLLSSTQRCMLAQVVSAPDHKYVEVACRVSFSWWKAQSAPRTTSSSSAAATIASLQGSPLRSLRHRMADVGHQDPKGPTSGNDFSRTWGRVKQEASVVSVAAVCMGTGASLGFTPGFLATAFQDDLGVSRGQVGLLVSVYFGCTGIGSVLGGRITERIGARLAVVTDMLTVAAAGAASALIGTYWSLLLGAVVAGLGYSLVNAGTNVAIGRSVPLKRRTLAMSLKTGGVPVMATVAAALAPLSASRWGWQAISATVVVMALLSAALAFFVLADDRPARTDVKTRDPLPKGFIWWPIAAFLMIAGSQPLFSWIVPYLEQELQASPATAGRVSAFAFGTGVVMMMVNARRADRRTADQRMRLIVVLVLAILAGTLLVLSGAQLGLAVAAVGVAVGLSAQLASIGTMHASIVDRAPGAVARATGLTMTGYYLGAFFSPAAFGFLVDATGNFYTSWAATAVLLVLAVAAWWRAGVGLGVNKSSNRTGERAWEVTALEDTALEDLAARSPQSPEPHQA